MRDPLVPTAPLGELASRAVTRAGLDPAAAARQSRILAGEVLGTFGLVFLGSGAAHIDDLTGDVTRVGIGLSFGLTVAAMVLTFGRVSGAHINPAVTLALWVSGHFPGRQVLPYFGAQIAGALIGASVLHGLFRNHTETLGGTLPAGTVEQSFGLEIVLTFFLVYVLLVVAFEWRAALPIVAATAGIVVGLEATAAGEISGASMNPARSFGPAAIAWVWDDHWIYWAAPAIGAIIAAGCHLLLRRDGKDEAYWGTPPSPADL